MATFEGTKGNGGRQLPCTLQAPPSPQASPASSAVYRQPPSAVQLPEGTEHSRGAQVTRVPRQPAVAIAAIVDGAVLCVIAGGAHGRLVAAARIGHAHARRRPALPRGRLGALADLPHARPAVVAAIQGGAVVAVFTRRPWGGEVAAARVDHAQPTGHEAARGRGVALHLLTALAAPVAAGLSGDAGIAGGAGAIGAVDVGAVGLSVGVVVEPVGAGRLDGGVHLPQQQRRVDDQPLAEAALDGHRVLDRLGGVLAIGVAEAGRAEHDGVGQIALRHAHVEDALAGDGHAARLVADLTPRGGHHRVARGDALVDADRHGDGGLALPRATREGDDEGERKHGEKLHG